MTESYSDRLRRRAAQLVLEQHVPPGQAAKILECTSRAVRRWVQEYLDQATRIPPSPSVAPPRFVPVVLEEDVPSEDSREEASSIPVEIRTSGGSTLRLSLDSLDDVVRLLQSLEGDRC